MGMPAPVEPRTGLGPHASHVSAHWLSKSVRHWLRLIVPDWSRRSSSIHLSDSGPLCPTAPTARVSEVHSQQQRILKVNYSLQPHLIIQHNPHGRHYVSHYSPSSICSVRVRFRTTFEVCHPRRCGWPKVTSGGASYLRQDSQGD